MAPARPWGSTRARAGGVALTARDTLELLCLARGAPADARPGAAMQRLRLEAAGLTRAVTAMAPDGREVSVGFAPTPEGLRVVARLRAEAAAERDTDAGEAVVAPPEVAQGGVCITPPAPGHDCEQGSKP